MWRLRQNHILVIALAASTAAAAGESVCRWVCESWRGDGELREDWHAYHLIGDVLRSDDLAIAPARDEAPSAPARRVDRALGLAVPDLAEAARQRDA